MTALRTAVRVAAAIALTAVVSVDAVALSRADGIHTGRLWVSDHGVVQHTTLPHCAVEDASSGPLPCTWNVGPRQDGNGRGLAYWVGRDSRTHYVWDTDPTIDPRNADWRWVSQPLADALAESTFPMAGRRPWERCVTDVLSGHRWVSCPDGMTRKVD